MKAIIYCRKSTDREDRQVQSLTDQLKWCEDIAKNLWYDVVDTISESITGKTPEIRPGFKKMLKLLKEWKAERIITWKVNRLARNPIDQSYIEWYLQEWIIKEIVSADCFFRTWDNVLMLRMHFGMATQYSIDLKKDTVRGMLAKVEKWWIVAKPPRGYSIEGWEAIPDDEARAIRDIFELRAKWWSMPDIADEIYKKYWFKTKKWWPVMHTYIAKVLANPFYYGVIQWAWELFSGRHEPIIDKELWDKVNNINRWVSYEKKADNVHFWLRWLILNGETWSILTASLVKGKYVYFHTQSRTKGKIYINQQAIIDWFEANIHLFVLPKPLFEPVKKTFGDLLKWKQDDTSSMRKKFQKKEAELTTKKQKLLDMRLSGELSQEEYLEEKNRITNEIQDIKSSLFSVDALDDDILNSVDTIIVFCTNLVWVWKNADLWWKIDIIKLLITNLFVSEKNEFTFSFFPLWEACYEVNKNPHKYGDLSFDYFWLPNMVGWLNSPLSMLVKGMIMESRRVELYREFERKYSHLL